jgi:hypothetical protein
VQEQSGESTVGTGCLKVAMAYTTAVATSPTGHSGTLSGVDPSMFSLHFDARQDGRDIADDPMLVELIASLHVTQIAAAPAMVPTSPRRTDDASSKDEGPRPLSSPRHNCGSPHVDGPLSDSSRDGTVCTVQSVIEAFKRLL